MAEHIREFETGLVLQRDGRAIEMAFDLEFTNSTALGSAELLQALSSHAARQR
jgi:hypothetical protein